jgi:hypothetical protein
MITERHSDFDPEGSALQVAELPRYRCHKEVWALKIQAVDLITRPNPTIAELEDILNSQSDEPTAMLPTGESVHQPKATLTFTDKGYAPIEVDAAYVMKHDPQPGGYYVVYKDGYKSFSPAEAFEEGYTRI